MCKFKKFDLNRKKICLGLFKAMILTIFLDNKLDVIKVNELVYKQLNSRFFKEIYHLLIDFSVHLGRMSLVYFIVFIAFFLAFMLIDSWYNNRLGKFQYGISIFLSLAVLFKYALDLELPVSETSYFHLLILNGTQCIKSILTFSSWFILFNTIQKIVESCLLRLLKQDNKRNMPLVHNHSNLNWKKHLIRNTLVILLFWTPFLIIDYPGVLIYDGVTQLMQYNGYEALRTDHPIASTLILNYSFNIGKFIGIPKVGLFIYVLVQATLLASVFGAVITWISINTNHRAVQKGLFFFFGLLPIVLTFVPLISKDIIFASAFVLLNLLIAISLFNSNTKINRIIFLGILLSSTVSMLFRKNILYVIVLFVLISLILFLMKKKFVKINLILALFLSIFLFKGVDSVLANAYGANTDGLRRESLSLPFQQTARYIKYHESEMSKNEKEKINKVLKIENIGERYRPKLSNNVKYYHNEDATTTEMRDYFLVWLYEFSQHPVTYFEATIDQNISLFTLFTRNEYFNHLTAGYREGVAERNKIYSDYSLKVSPTRWSLQEIKLKCYQIFDRLPVLGLLDNPSMYIILLLFLIGLAVKFKLMQSLYIFLPTLIMLLTLIAGPVVEGYTRYTALFVFLFPILFLSFMLDLKYQKVKNRKSGFLLNDIGKEQSRNY